MRTMASVADRSAVANGTPLGQLKNLARPLIPAPIWFRLQTVAYRLGKKKYWYGPGETSKAHPRRLREGFFDTYCRGQGLDIGQGGDPIVPGVRGWDLVDGDAQYLRGVEDEIFDFVYGSHILEHMRNPAEALRNWWRTVKRGGFLIVAVPDRDLYEGKQRLPSRKNPDHKTFFLLDADDPPDTVGLLPLLGRTLDGCLIREAKRCDDVMSGEFQLEVVAQKTKPLDPDM